MENAKEKIIVKEIIPTNFHNISILLFKKQAGLGYTYSLGRKISFVILSGR